MSGVVRDGADGLFGLFLDVPAVFDAVINKGNEASCNNNAKDLLTWGAKW